MRSLQLTKSHPAPSGAPLPSSRSSATINHSKISSNASVCSSTSLPPSALRKGKYDTSYGQNGTQTAGPSVDLSIIHSAYGKNASLYNILRIKPSADNNTIRKAYLKQGRKTLLDHGIARKNSNGVCKFVTSGAVPKKLEDVPIEARKKFQAISIAYEILSTPELKRAYDANELVERQPIDLRRVTSGNSVRWNPFVEEKIIEDADPEEHSHRRKTSDDGWLHSHLQKLDAEAELFLNGDFLDELDDSIASMSESLSESIGSLMKKGMGGSHPAGGGQVHSSNGVQTNLSKAEHPCSLKDRTRPRTPVNVQTKFNEEFKVASPAKQTPSLTSPCSVMGVHEFVNEVVDGAAELLAESFSSLLDRTTEKKIVSRKLAVVTPTSVEELSALERKRLDEQLREGFGEPFYCPPSPQR